MSLTLRTDVTSVKIYNNLILAGIGGSINIYEKENCKFRQRIHCFQGQKIYGIVPSKFDNKILVFGGKQFTVLTVTTSENGQAFERQFEPVVCDDWLHSAVWLNAEHVALLTAHNVVQDWNIISQTLSSQSVSKDNSILYSGWLQAVGAELLVLAGTVFSQVIVYVYGEEPLHRLEGHKGVIFSIACDLESGIIVTTSDDRSVRIWGARVSPQYPSTTIEYWRNIDIICKHELYGHSARVMRCCIINDKVISVGEDSTICFWNYDGGLSKKIMSHQNSSIWCVDADKDIVVTGGGDCALISHPLSLATEYGEAETLILSKIPKKVLLTSRRNKVILTDNEILYYNVEENTNTTTNLSHESTYKLLSISSCKQIIAVADMSGKLDVFIENCKDTANLIKAIDTKLPIDKILSMHCVGNRHVVICADRGAVTVLGTKDSKIEIVSEYVLPACKERWLTAAAIDAARHLLLLGDRCGNLHVYVTGQTNPTKSFSKLHGRYGPTSITIRNDEIVTTGRDGTIKYFSINENKVNLMTGRDLEFKWVEKFLDRDGNIVCGFQERVFVVYNLKSNRKLLKVACGGGHRSWDAARYFRKVHEGYEECIELVYLKNSDINIVKFQLNKIVSKNLVNGSHSKEINCLKSYRLSETLTFYISGGEDTTLRISSINEALEFEDRMIYKQLSSIRAVKTCPLTDNSLLLISAGGRAQICIKIIYFIQTNEKVEVKTKELVDYMIKGADKTRKVNLNWKNSSVDFDPETRIMDVDYVQKGNKFLIFAGCSDASLRMFTLNDLKEPALASTFEFKYHRTCILKTTCINFHNRNILVTCTTRSEVAFWDIEDMNENTEPFFVLRTNKSGINGFASKTIENDRLLVATAGDDNALHLVLLEADQTGVRSMRVIGSVVMDRLHSSEITGVCIVDKFVVCASIDQRVSVCSWQETGGLSAALVTQAASDVADIQGLEVITYSSSSITVCVFGKGMEVIQIPTPTH